MHTVQAADTSLLFECTILHSGKGNITLLPVDSSVVQSVHVGDIIAYTVACEPRIYFKLFYNCCTRYLVCALLAVLYVVHNSS